MLAGTDSGAPIAKRREGAGSWSIDPDTRTEKAIARFPRQGFVAGPGVVLPEMVFAEIDIPGVFLPEPHAQLALLSREVAFP
ncbi:hypothetical protein [Streptomyces sp. NPDC001100]